MKELKSQSQKVSIFTSKSNILKFLQSRLKYSKIERILDFTVDDWNKNKNQILQQVKSTFYKKKVIIRSSAIGEDSDYSSEAGSYESILNINSSSRTQLISAINKVIKSYAHKKNFNLKNQILIQTQAVDIVTSGVIFSRTPDNGAPYYVINFEDGISTIGVTHGSVGNTIKIARHLGIKAIGEKWKSLLQSVKEIETVVQSNSLDIEFGITKNSTIVIFQVRPITSILKSISTLDKKIIKLINKNKNQFLSLKNQKTISNNLIFSTILRRSFGSSEKKCPDPVSVLDMV